MPIELKQNGRIQISRCALWVSAWGCSACSTLVDSRKATFDDVDFVDAASPPIGDAGSAAGVSLSGDARAEDAAVLGETTYAGADASVVDAGDRDELDSSIPPLSEPSALDAASPPTAAPEPDPVDDQVVVDETVQPPDDGGPTDTNSMQSADASSGDDVLPRPEPCVLAIDLNPGVVTPSFSPDVPDYRATLGLWTDSFELTLEIAPGCAVKVNSIPIVSGELRTFSFLDVSIPLSIEATDSDANVSVHSVIVERPWPTGLHAVERQANQLFGEALCLVDSTLVVAATHFDVPGPSGSIADAGKLYIFERDEAGEWIYQQGLVSSAPQTSGLMGRAIALDGDTLVVNDGSLGTPTEEAVEVWAKQVGVWERQGRLRPRVWDEADGFGVRIALQGDVLAVSATREDSAAGEDDNSATDAGAVYVFERAAGLWTQSAFLKPNVSEAGDRFGGGLALSGNWLFVGAHYEAAAGTEPSDNSALAAGATYAFERTESGWVQRQFIKPPEVNAGALLGFRVTVDADTLAIAAPLEPSARGQTGAIHVFRRQSDDWAYEALVQSSRSNDQDFFGSPLALAGDRMVAADIHQGDSLPIDPTLGGVDSGAVMLFERADGTWHERAVLKPPTSRAGDQFGAGLSFDGPTLVVGAPYVDVPIESSSGLINDEGSVLIWEVE